MSKKYTFEDLNKMSTKDLKGALDVKREELSEAQAQRFRVMGMIMFTQDAIAAERGDK